MTRPITEFTVADLEYLNDIEFESFSTDDAADLGLVTIAVIREWDLSLAVDVVLGSDLVFRAKLKNTDESNNPWLQKKAAAAIHFGEASLLVNKRHLEAGTPFENRTDVDHEAIKAHGGSIPLRVAGEIAGTITVSGEPDAVDHEVAAEALRRYIASR